MTCQELVPVKQGLPNIGVNDCQQNVMLNGVSGQQNVIVSGVSGQQNGMVSGVSGQQDVMMNDAYLQ